MRDSLEIRVGLFVLAALGVLAYMGFQIGAFRFDRMRYKTYTMFFKDVSGLARKADVKIAGVKVGWVEKINLIKEDDTVQASATVLISKEYDLYCDAYAIVRQDGLLGPKYLEVIPGNPLMSRLTDGSALGRPSVAPTSVDELLQQFKQIASNVEDVTQSFDKVVGGAEGQEQLRSIFNNLDLAMKRMASLTQVVDRALSDNEENINKFFEIGAQVERITHRLESEVLPAMKGDMEKIADAFDRDLGRVANHVEATADVFGQASVQARDGFKSITAVVEKIDEGRGLLGKLVNDDETYKDLKVAIQGVKNYFAKTDSMQIIFDSHVESMYRPAENYRFEDSKGYLDIRIHPTEDKFYLLQLSTSEKGFISRTEVQRLYYDHSGQLVDPRNLVLNDKDKLEFIYRQKDVVFWRNSFKVGVQFGKIFGNIAFRFGLIEGTAGIGVDFDVPLHSRHLRWLTSFEAFDMRGFNRYDDRRPHFKWINRMYALNNLYFVFGADDFISKCNASAFLGAGIRFGDDDFKFLLSSLSSFISANTTSSTISVNI